MLTLFLVAVTVLVSAVCFSNQELFYRLLFNPYSIFERKQWYRFFTHGFVHANWMHLLVNMLVFFFFGDHVHQYFLYFLGAKGHLFFLLLYIGGIGFAVLPSYRKHRDNYLYNGVGASGAVAAILFSSIVFDPASKICLYGVLCLPGIVWGIAYLAYEYYMGKKGNTNINHDAHFFGAVYGVVFTLISVPDSAVLFYNRLLYLFS